MGKQIILVHGTNGEGYSDATIKRLSTLNEALKYIGSVFNGRRPDIDSDRQYAAKNGFSFYTTEVEGNTERINVYVVDQNDVVLVSVNANITQYDIHKYPNKMAAMKALNEYKKLITEPEEGNTDVCASGQGVDGYFHFEIV